MVLGFYNDFGLETAAKSTEQQTLQLASRLGHSCARFTFGERVGFAMEEWKAVVGFEGRYEVSDHGRVRALFYGARGRHKPGRILKPKTLRHGYLFIGLYTEDKKYEYRTIHRMVLESFVGLRPLGNEARHLDGTRNNNHLVNLKWGTYQENRDDMIRHGTSTRGKRM